MHAWHAVPSCKWNKDEKTPMQGDRRISVIGASIADRGSVFEPTAVFAVGEFAGAVGDRRRSEDRKSVVPALEFFHLVP